MSVEKASDDLSSTGERRRPGSTELYADWAARMQRGRGRHAAINRNLNSWANYKTGLTRPACRGSPISP